MAKHTFYDADLASPLGLTPWLACNASTAHLPYSIHELSLRSFLALWTGKAEEKEGRERQVEVEGDESDVPSCPSDPSDATLAGSACSPLAGSTLDKIYYFGSLAPELRPDIQPTSFLFLTERDEERARHFLWLSSPEVALHTHFDQDHNFFVQIHGRKRIVLFPPSASDWLYPYPRTHPLWHKSQVDFQRPVRSVFPDYDRALSSALQVTLEPGDLLYIPPYWWHRVETLSSSASVSSWSTFSAVESNMSALYGLSHQFDSLVEERGRVFALRLYLDMIVEKLYSDGDTPSVFHRLLATRYPRLRHYFPPAFVCTSAPIPTSKNIVGNTELDARIAYKYLAALSPEVRDFLFADYCEELVASVLSASLSYAFFRQCFVGQGYVIRNTEAVDGTGPYLWAVK